MNQTKTLRMRANAKINLTLDITGKRPDGYHSLSMIMQSVSLFDRVTVSLQENCPPTENIQIICNDPSVPCGAQNLAYKAASAFFSASRIPNSGVLVAIEKKIPAQAGLAGGSADAAAVLFALNHLLDEPLSRSELLSIGQSVGADVPFCLTGGTQLAEGIGEILSPLPAMHPFPIVIVKPSFSSSTAEAYHAADSACLVHPSALAAVAALRNGNLTALSAALGNSFESVVAPEQIAAIKQDFIENGAVGSSMSGSGTAVFGLFDSPTAAEMCRRTFLQQYHDVFLVFPAHSGIEIEPIV